MSDGEFGDEFLDQVLADGQDELSSIVNRAADVEAARQRGDTADAARRSGPRQGRPSAEDRMARAISRVQDGTYMPPPMFAPREPARAVSGQFAWLCGNPDEYGRCASPQHGAGCHVVVESAAANGSADAVRAWREVLSRHPGPVPEPGGQGDGYPDVSGLAAALHLTGSSPNADRRTEIAADAMARQALGGWR